jgi:toxin ParE1/3/4
VKVAWHRRAQRDLLKIVRYVAEDNLDAALRLRESIRGQVALFAEMPEAGRRGRVRGTRELVIAGTRYIVAYAAMRDEVVVLRVLHGARLWPERL